MRTIRNNENAVSPVVGVMLMLVVTIIIAAVVSAFAGGLAGDEIKTPQATIVADEIVINEAYDSDKSNWDEDAVAGKAADIYVVFEHKGGDPVNLNNIQIHLGSLKYSSQKTVISNAKTPNDDLEIVGDKAAIVSDFSTDWDTYIEGYPDHESLVKTGDKFVLHADYAKELENVSSHNIYRTQICWHDDEAASGFSIESGDVLLYDIIDTSSGRVISSGQIMVPEFFCQTS